MNLAFDPTLYAIVDVQDGDDGPATDAVARAVAGGVTLVQLRGKGLEPRRLARRARELVRLLEPLGLPLVVNDRPDVARAAGARGVHLGQSDLPPDAARRFWPEGLIGVSVHSLEELRRAVAGGADYVASGSLFATGSKGNATPLDHEVFRAIVDASPVPVVGIGGIESANAGRVAALGAAGVAVIRGLWSAPDVSERAAAYRTAFAAGRPGR